MGFVVAISFTGGLVFWLAGAWPVTGFLGLDALAIWYAFKLNYRHGRTQELIEISGSEINVTRTSPKGQEISWAANPYWVRVDATFDDEDNCIELALASKGERLVIGAFLGPDARGDAAKRLRAALAVCR